MRLYEFRKWCLTKKCATMKKAILKDLLAGSVFITKASKILRVERHETDGTTICTRLADKYHYETIKSNAEVFLME